MPDVAYFVLAGQSNMEGWLKDPSALDAFHDEFLKLNPQYNDVQFINGTRGGSAILQASAELDAEERSSGYSDAVAENYWYNEKTGGDGPDLTLYADKLAQETAGKTIVGILWAQGEADTAYVREGNASLYQQGLVYVLQRLMDITGAQNVYIQGLGDRSTYLERLSGGLDPIHAVQQALPDEYPWAHLSTAVYDLPLRDSVHLTDPGYETAAIRMADAISTGVASPMLGSATVTADGKIYVAMDVAPGQTLDALQDSKAFQIVGSHGDVGIGSITVDAAAGLVIITPDSPVSGSELKYATADISYALQDSDFLYASGISGPVPVQPFELSLHQSGISIQAYEGGYRLAGGNASESISGFASNDLLYGYDGNDRLDGGTGRNGLYGGTGNDTYYVDNSTTSVHENANEGTDLVVASVNFTLSANVENVTLSDGAVTAKGNDLDNVIRGDDVANALYGYGGSDHLYGYDGNDKLDGGTGVNYLYGGTGDDTYYVDDATSYTYENPGEGTDRVYASVSLTLRANVENLYLTGSAAIAGSGNDLANIIEGNDAANSLKGLGGDDKLYGGGGADSIFGNDGNDWIEGGAGKDTMAGGAGSDSFVFRDGDFGGATTATADRITDFTQGEDHIRLNYVDADTTLAGDQAFSFIGTADFDGHAGELRYTESGSYTFVSGDTNGDGTADFMIRLDGLHTLTSHDFVL